MNNIAASSEPLTGTLEHRNRHFAQLIAQARQGDIAAFEALYTLTMHWLLARIRRMVDDGQAEDILAEVYLQVWRSLASFDESRGPAAVWLAMIARSRVLDHLRRQKRIGRGAVADALDEEPGHGDGPEQILTHEQDTRLLRLSMSNLTPDERLVLGLAYFRDSTQQEIATQTGLPLARVKLLLARAQQKLRLQFTVVARAAVPVSCVASQ